MSKNSSKFTIENLKDSSAGASFNERAGGGAYVVGMVVTPGAPSDSGSISSSEFGIETLKRIRLEDDNNNSIEEEEEEDIEVDVEEIEEEEEDPHDPADNLEEGGEAARIPRPHSADPYDDSELEDGEEKENCSGSSCHKSSSPSTITNEEEEAEGDEGEVNVDSWVVHLRFFHFHSTFTLYQSIL